MRHSEEVEYIQNLWNSNEILKIYYSSLLFFKKQVDIELDRLEGYIKTTSIIPQTEPEMREIEKLTLNEIDKIKPSYSNTLKEDIYAAARNQNGEYVCAKCKKTFPNRIGVQIDHIKPMSKGGLTVRDNLQVLCRKCNGKKGDKE